MDTPRKILCHGLPAALAAALQEQWRAEDVLLTEEGENPAMILGYGEIGQDVRLRYKATPVLALPSPPFRLGKLMRQIRQILSDPALYLEEVPLGPYTLFPAERTAHDRAGRAIDLTDRETDMLIYLAQAKGHFSTREDLLRHVWRYQQGVDTHTLETHIYRLRQKLEETPEQPKFLITEERGYRIAIE